MKNHFALAIDNILQKNNYLYSVLNYVLAFTTCRSELIPELFINKTMLKSNEIPIQNENFDLSIPLYKIDWYYQFQLTFCQKESNGIFLLIAIPLRRKTIFSLTIEKLLPIPI